MSKSSSYMVGGRVPLALLEFIDEDVANGNFMNRSDWIGCACREFMKIRQKEIAEQSRDALGGGANKRLKPTGNARQVGSPLAA